MNNDDLPALPQTPLGRYRHYKGNAYEVIGVVRHSETLEPMVLYRPLRAGATLWVRPHAMFFGDVTVDGPDHSKVTQPRFVKLPDPE